MNNYTNGAGSYKQQHDQFLALFNKADQAFAAEEQAVWENGLIDRTTPAQSREEDMDITSANNLYLVSLNNK